jgi:hypothetical protein
MAKPKRFIEMLQSKARGMIAVEGEVVAADGVFGRVVTVEWFVQKRKAPSS